MKKITNKTVKKYQFSFHGPLEVTIILRGKKEDYTSSYDSNYTEDI